MNVQQFLSMTTAVFAVLQLRAILWNSSWAAAAAVSSYHSPQCDQVHELTAGTHQLSTTNVITIDSPNYPFTQYPPRSSCRHSIRAPLGYTITVQCNINLPVTGAATDTTYTDSRHCQTDFLYISTPATQEANDGYFEYFCGRGYVSRTSVFNALTLAYESKSDSVAGYFTCTAFASRKNCDCGWSPRSLPGVGGGWFGGNGRIIGGQEAVANEYAGMAGLVDKQTGRVFCGGSIIHQRYVLTAAHCVASDSDHADGGAFYILVGDHDITTGADSKYSKLYYVEEVRRHQDFDRAGFDNDIALLRTTEDIIWSRAVGPACLPFRFFGNTFDNQIVEISGWGTTAFGGSSSNQPARLQKTTVTTLSNAACKSMEDSPSFTAHVTEAILCTYSATGQDACQMDSGGGLLWRNQDRGARGDDGRLYLVGVISYGRQCGRSTPGFNTRITNYLNWIIANSRGANFCIPG